MMACCLLLRTESVLFITEVGLMQAELNVSFFQIWRLGEAYQSLYYVHLTTEYAAGFITHTQMSLSRSFHLTPWRMHTSIALFGSFATSLNPLTTHTCSGALWLIFSQTEGQLWLSHSLIVSFSECQLMGYCWSVINGKEAHYSSSTMFWCFG